MNIDIAFFIILNFCKNKTEYERNDCINVMVNCSWEEGKGLSETKSKECIRNYYKYNKFYLDKWSEDK